MSTILRVSVAFSRKAWSCDGFSSSHGLISRTIRLEHKNFQQNIYRRCQQTKCYSSVADKDGVEKKKVVFLGTPAVAAKSLEILYEVTQRHGLFLFVV